eukprot:3104924-Heterocapsa_arctica.AAC.1
MVIVGALLSFALSAVVSDPFALFSDPFEHFSSYFVENDQRFARHPMAMARGLPHTPVPLK